MPDARMSEPWPEQRASFIARRASELMRQQQISFTFVPSHSANFLNYFSDAVHEEIQAYAPDPFVYLLPGEAARQADVVIHMASGKEEDAARLWADRYGRRHDALCALWLWDNHTWGMGNRQVAAASDIVFASHGYVSDYLLGPAALLAGHVPACSAQWTHDEAERFFGQNADSPRQDKLLFNYVNYGPEYPERYRILSALSAGLKPIENLQMTKNDKSRYFGMSREQRFLEWMQYKATVIVPLDRDLSTRVFDALLAGLVLIVPEHIPDIDLVIPRPHQERLGIVRVSDLELDTVQSAAYEALRLYDDMGAEGAYARHRYALENHMLVNRITAVLETIWRIGSGEFSIVFGEQGSRYGLLMKNTV